MAGGRSVCASISTGWREAWPASAWRRPCRTPPGSEVCRELVVRNGGGDQYIYLQVNARRGVRSKPRLAGGIEADIVRLHQHPRALSGNLTEGGVAAITAADTRWARRDIKSTALLANTLLKRLAVDAGAFETIMLEDGALTEGSSTTVHVIIEGEIRTPPNGHHILPGTTRDVVGSWRQASGSRRAAAKWRKPNCAPQTVWLHSPLVGCSRSRALEAGRSPRRPGPLFGRMHTAFVDHIRELAGAPAYERRRPLEFPCEFPIKVMGRQDSGIKALTRAIVERHTGPLADSNVRVRTSTDGNFLCASRSIIAALSREQLDAIYRELTACKAVLMAL